MLSDGNVVAFDNAFTNVYNSDDALKIANSSENLGIKKDDKILALEARSPVTGADTVFYTFSNLRRQGYQFRFKPENMAPGISAKLVDKFLNTTSDISLTDTSSVDFVITADPASALPDRFYLIFKASSGLQSGLPAAVKNPVQKHNIVIGKSQGNMEITKTGISIYPNPVINKTVHIQFINQPKGSYLLEIINTAGSTIYTKTIHSDVNNFIELMQIKESTPSGDYQLKIVAPGNIITVKSFIIQ